MSAFMGVGWVWQALECSNGSHQKCDSTQGKEQQIIFVESLSLSLSTQEKEKSIIFDLTALLKEFLTDRGNKFPIKC